MRFHTYAQLYIYGFVFEKEMRAAMHQLFLNSDDRINIAALHQDCPVLKFFQSMQIDQFDACLGTNN